MLNQKLLRETQPLGSQREIINVKPMVDSSCIQLWWEQAYKARVKPKALLN